jgi:hypothetical protein
MSPTIVYLAAGDNEEGFWVQLLVIVVLAAGAGVYSIAKSRARRPVGGALKELYSRLTSAAKSAVGRRPVRFAELQKTEDKYPSSVIRPVSSFEAAQPSAKGRDLKSGMELLAKGFLVGVVEQTDAIDQLDIAMRRLCFAELVRRGELTAVASDALKVYTLDEYGFFDKSIRCEAMVELAGRTGKAPQDAAEQTTVNAYREIDG